MRGAKKKIWVPCGFLLLPFIGIEEKGEGKTDSEEGGGLPKGRVFSEGGGGKLCLRARRAKKEGRKECPSPLGKGAIGGLPW